MPHIDPWARHWWDRRACKLVSEICEMFSRASCHVDERHWVSRGDREVCWGCHDSEGHSRQFHHRRSAQQSRTHIKDEVEPQRSTAMGLHRLCTRADKATILCLRVALEQVGASLVDFSFSVAAPTRASRTNILTNNLGAREFVHLLWPPYRHFFFNRQG